MTQTLSVQARAFSSPVASAANLVRPTSEIESEVARLGNIIGSLDLALADLAGRMTPVRADEPPADRTLGERETQPLTPLGCQLRDLSARVESVLGAVHYQLRTLAL